MSFTFPQSVENQIKDFAKARNISPDEAALTLVAAALAATNGEAPMLVRERHPELYDLVEQAISDIDAGKSTPWQKFLIIRTLRPFRRYTGACQNKIGARRTRLSRGTNGTRHS